MGEDETVKQGPNILTEITQAIESNGNIQSLKLSNLDINDE